MYFTQPLLNQLKNPYFLSLLNYIFTVIKIHFYNAMKLERGGKIAMIKFRAYERPNNQI